MKNFVATLLIMSQVIEHCLEAASIGLVIFIFGWDYVSALEQCYIRFISG